MSSFIKFIFCQKSVLIANPLYDGKAKTGAIRIFRFPETVENVVLVQCVRTRVTDRKAIFLRLQKDSAAWLRMPDSIGDQVTDERISQLLVHRYVQIFD